ncbi:hypothetical protein GCM10008927_17320 [Amylibacter ulvae]|uniref:DUF1467 domain-containing protein n=1 Tax=Paramylibacter ulvae TaxID=1651968 RepID=A0ABQ3D292_9RHOB|nr:DUF1467 family protein [Amylibacter ulvae]GHA52418.1 hypothetical protein GCM10008927_17320 [Amylibacter ulvae]
MNISAALVLLAVTWFMVLFIVLPIRLKSQGEDNNVVPGTPASAPADPQIKKRMLIVTIISIPLWLFFVWLISSGLITAEQMDIYNIIESN